MILRALPALLSIALLIGVTHAPAQAEEFVENRCGNQDPGGNVQNVGPHSPRQKMKTYMGCMH